MKRKLAVLAVVAMALTAGCVGGFLGGGSGGGAKQSPPPVDHVPGKSSFVLSYDADLVKDSATKSVANTYLAERVPADSDRPRTLQGYLEKTQNDTFQDVNLSMSAVGGVMAFGKIPDSPMGMGAGGNLYFGVLVRSEWTQSQIVDALRKENDLTEETYKGVTVYKYESESTSATNAFAKYGDSLYAFGTLKSVKDVIDVSKGDAEGLSGEVASAYESTPSDGYVRFATVLPKQYRTLLNRYSKRQSQVQLNFGDITHVSGAYYTEGGQDGTIGTELNLHISSSDSASQLQKQINGTLTLAQGAVSNETIQQQLQALSVERDGSTVSLVYESSVGNIETAIEQYVSPPRQGGAPASRVSAD